MNMTTKDAILGCDGRYIADFDFKADRLWCDEEFEERMRPDTFLCYALAPEFEIDEKFTPEPSASKAAALWTCRMADTVDDVNIDRHKSAGTYFFYANSFMRNFALADPLNLELRKYGALVFHYFICGKWHQVLVDGFLRLPNEWQEWYGAKNGRKRLENVLMPNLLYAFYLKGLEKLVRSKNMSYDVHNMLVTDIARIMLGDQLLNVSRASLLTLPNVLTRDYDWTKCVSLTDTYMPWKVENRQYFLNKISGHILQRTNTGHCIDLSTLCNAYLNLIIYKAPKYAWRNLTDDNPRVCISFCLYLSILINIVIYI
jgi:hypothetical protein